MGEYLCSGTKAEKKKKEKKEEIRRKEEIKGKKRKEKEKKLFFSFLKSKDVLPSISKSRKPVSN